MFVKHNTNNLYFQKGTGLPSFKHPKRHPGGDHIARQVCTPFVLIIHKVKSDAETQEVLAFQYPFKG